MSPLCPALVETAVASADVGKHLITSCLSVINIDQNH